MYTKQVAFGLAIINILITFIIILFATMFIYIYLPSTRIAVKDTLIGAVFSSVSLMLGSTLFAYYSTNIWGYSKIYGTIGSVIVLLVWLYLGAVIILLGGEINAEIMQKRGK